MKRVITTIALIGPLIFAGRGHATLIDRGNGLIYDTVLNITWTQNANLLGFPLTWDGARGNANILVFGGFDDWRLSALGPTGPLPIAFDCGTGTAAQCAASGNELGYMYYFNLTPAGDPDGRTDPGTNLKGNQGPFTNIQSVYWANNPCCVPPIMAWIFEFANGGQFTQLSDDDQFFAWFVRDGDVVPEPGSVLLLGAGLLELWVGAPKVG